MFTSAKEANLFIGRRLLNNRFDFEVFTPDNLERECFEELCSYEEAREVFEDPDKTVVVQTNWYIMKEVIEYTITVFKYYFLQQLKQDDCLFYSSRGPN